MSTYQELRGLKIKYLTANPDPGMAGDVWYDASPAFALKAFVGRGAWSAGAANTTAREGTTAFAGTQTAALMAGGNVPPYTAITEEYNGSGWSAGGNLNLARATYAGIGTQTAGLTAGGYTGSNQAVSEEYNGSTWTEGNNINTGRRGFQGCGLQTAGLLVSGYTTAFVTVVEEYNGTSWSEVTDIPAARTSGGMVGTQTSAMQIAGEPGYTSTTFKYDGTNWTAGDALNTGRGQGGYGGADKDAAIAISGETSPGAVTVNCEFYDGSAWTEGANVATAGNPNGASPLGTSLTSLFGAGASRTTNTEEFNNSFEVVTAGAWASGGNLNTARYYLGAAGTQTAGLAISGNTGSRTVNVESYDGSSLT